MNRRFTPVRRTRNTADAVGKVRVQVYLVGPRHAHVRGNVVRTFTVARSTVTSVAEQIKRVVGA